jgi:hypothetical protein
MCTADPRIQDPDFFNKKTFLFFGSSEIPGDSFPFQKKSFDPRFSGPLGFTTRQYKKKFRERYPRVFIGLFVGTCLSLFFRYLYQNTYTVVASCFI